MKKLASKIANEEGLKVETSIGNIREILRVLREIIYDDPNVLLELLNLEVKKKKR